MVCAAVLEAVVEVDVEADAASGPLLLLLLNLGCEKEREFSEAGSGT